MKGINILYFLVTQPSNLGDLIINKSYVDSLSKKGKVYIDDYNIPNKFKKYLYSGTTNVFPLRSKYRALSFKTLRGVLYFFNRNEFHYITKSPGPFNFSNNVKTIAKYTILFFYFLMFRIKKSKVLLIGSEFETNGIVGEFYFKFCFKFVDFLFTRSKVNRQKLKNIGIKNVDYSPDLCLNLKVKEQTIKCKDVVGFSFRKELENKVLSDRVEILVNYYINLGYDVLFFFQVESDKEFNQELFNKNKDKKGVLFRESLFWYDDIEKYSNFNYVISNRLHVLLLGLVHYAQPKALISQDNKFGIKIKNVLNSLQLDCIINFKQLNNFRFDDNDLSKKKIDRLLESNSMKIVDIINETII